MTDNIIIRKLPDKLGEYLKAVPKAAIAFSGGVDSCYLLYAAATAGVEVRAYYVKSQFQPRFELEDAQRMANSLGVKMTVISVDALSCPEVAGNPEDRCYHCKKVIFKNITKKAASDGFKVLMDGTNASDDAGDRPGMRALKELEVMSPLREAGITKAQLRQEARMAGLFTWDKPAYACLATRIPTGVPLDADTLIKVEKAEDKLFELGFTDFRARVMGTAVKLQLPAAQLERAAKLHVQLTQMLSPYFGEVLLDLKAR